MNRPASTAADPAGVRHGRWGEAIRVRTWAWREYIAATLVIGALTLGFFNPLFRSHATFSDVAGHQTVIWPWTAYQNGFNDTYPQSDEADVFYPWEVFASHSLHHGSFPLWNRFVFGGTPFLTNGSGGVSYPPRLLLALAVPPSWAHDLFMLLHVFLSGLAMFFLMKELRTGFLGALLASIAWTFSSYTFAWIQLEYVVVVSVCLPAGVALVHRAVERRSWVAAGCAGIALGIASLSTVFITLLVFPVVLLYELALAARPFFGSRGLRARLLALRETAVTAVTALCCAAVVLLPTALVSNELGRTRLSYGAMRKDWSVPFSAFWHVFWPQSDPVSADLLHEMTFVGTAVALLAIVGALRRVRGAALGRWLAIGTLLVTTGTPALWPAYHLLPGFAYFKPLGRALFLWCFAIALLGGLGLDGIVRWCRDPRVGVGRRMLPPSASKWTVQALRGHRGPLFGAAVALALGGIYWTSSQLITFGRHLNPPFQPRRAAFLYPRTPAISALLQDRARLPRNEPQRIFPLRRDPIGVPFTAPVMYASHSNVFDIESAAGYESLYPRRMSALWRVVAGETPGHALDNPQFGAYFPSYFVGSTRFDLLPRLGVTTIFAPADVDQEPLWGPKRYAPLSLRSVYAGPDGRVYDVGNAAPRAYVVYHSERADSDRAALERFTSPSFPFRTTVVLERAAKENEASRQAAVGPAAKMTGVGTNSESYSVTSGRPGWLVIASMWAPGWTATVNGRRARVERADYNLRAVRIPAGKSAVRLEYSPSGFTSGAVLTALGVISVPAVLLGRAAVHRRRRA